MTSVLLAGAVIATLWDIAAYMILIVPGFVTETNPLIATIASPAAVLARLLLLVVLGALTIAADQLRGPVLTAVVRVALATAIVVGLIGAVATLGALA